MANVSKNHLNSNSYQCQARVPVCQTSNSKRDKKDRAFGVLGQQNTKSSGARPSMDSRQSNPRFETYYIRNSISYRGSIASSTLKPSQEPMPKMLRILRPSGTSTSLPSHPKRAHMMTSSDFVSNSLIINS